MQEELANLIKRYTQDTPIDFPTYLQQRRRYVADYPLPLRNEIQNGYVVLADGEMLERMLYAQSFRQLGYQTFIIEKPRPDYDFGRIAVAPLKNDLEALLWMQTGYDFDEMQPAELVKTLASWRDYCNFKLIGVGLSWVEIDFESLPNNLEAFANIIIEFCPDVLGGRVRNEYDLAEQLQNERCIILRFRG